MSPTILRELTSLRNSLRGGSDHEQAAWYASMFPRAERSRAVKDPMRCFIAELPYRRHVEEMEREEAEIEAHGGKAKCDKCEEWQVKREVSAGFDPTAYTICLNCGDLVF